MYAQNGFLTYFSFTGGTQPTGTLFNVDVKDDGWPLELAYGGGAYDGLLPIAYEGCTAGGVGDPVFKGFHRQRFLVHGQPQRVYNVLSLPTLQLNVRFIPLITGQAMNNSAQSSVRSRQSKLLAALGDNGRADGAGAGNRLPETTTWSHDGLYMGEAGVQLAGHRLLVRSGAYMDGFSAVQLDGAEVVVSAESVTLPDGSSILRSSSSVVSIVCSGSASFTLVNSDHFLNIHHAQLHTAPADTDHVDGLLGQTANEQWTVKNTAAFKRHMESDFLLPQSEDELWSTSFEHNRYTQPTSTQ